MPKSIPDNISHHETYFYTNWSITIEYIPVTCTSVGTLAQINSDRLGIRNSRLLEHSVDIVIGSDAEPSIESVKRVLADSVFRDKIQQKTDDPVLLAKINRLENHDRKDVEPVLRRLDSLILSTRPT